MNELTTKLKALGEKWANLPDCKEANEIADECMDKLPEVLERVEKLERSCAEMRKVIGWLEAWLGCEYCPDGEFCAECEDMSSAMDHALSTSCGSDYIHRDEVRPLVEALRECWRKPEDPSDLSAVIRITLLAQKALTHAENLLKGETK